MPKREGGSFTTQITESKLKTSNDSGRGYFFQFLGFAVEAKRNGFITWGNEM